MITSFFFFVLTNDDLNSTISNWESYTYTNNNYGNIIFYKRSNIVQAYALLENLPTTGQMITMGAVPSTKLIPKNNYAVGCSYDFTAPYAPIGTIWIHDADGAFSVYKPISSTKVYISIIYMAK